MSRLLRSLLVALFLCTSTMLAVTAPASAARATTVAISNNAPISGETSNVYGRLSTDFVRTMTIEHLSGGSWRTLSTLKTTKSGSYVRPLVFTTPRTIRVKAAAVKYKGKKYAAILTSTRGVTPVPQTATISPNANDPIAGDSYTVTAAFKPVRTGRAVQLQENVGSEWTTIASGVEDTAGVARLVRPGNDRVGITELRVTASSRNGAPEFVSPVFEIEVKENTFDPSLQHMQAHEHTDAHEEEQQDANVSADGRWSVFAASDNNPDLPSTPDQIYLQNLLTGATRLVSKDSHGAPGERSSSSPAVSEDGRFVVYETESLNISGTTDSRHHIVRYDVENDTTKVITKLAASQDVVSGVGPDISNDGSAVSYRAGVMPSGSGSVTSYLAVWRATNNVTVLGNRRGTQLRISGNGRYVAFEEGGIDKPWDDPVEYWSFDVFRWDTTTGTVTRASTTANGTPSNRASGGPTISDDGRYIAFASYSSDLTSPAVTFDLRFYLRDMANGTTTLIDPTPNADPPTGEYLGRDHIDISGDGSKLAIARYVNPAQFPTLVIVDRATMTQETVFDEPTAKSVNGISHPRLSRTGNVVTFQTTTLGYDAAMRIGLN